ncbi:hypothetical protein GSH19_06655 [Lactobacillus sp. S2-2]|uniref:hypothetical protein n=1 Tax=Lactobacillus sp. S2-2 TaxID=2692917 RepID=UPI001F1F26F3|nr:hypothetical protein [Lactobacillus sp. S2-2]MCF6515824.1 hypothetical protein [Lactobacillus sp. S2-2]
MGLKKALFFGAIVTGTTALISYKSLNQLKKIKLKNNLLDATENVKDFVLDKFYYINDYKEDMKDCFVDGMNEIRQNESFDKENLNYKDLKNGTETFYPTEEPY